MNLKTLGLLGFFILYEFAWYFADMFLGPNFWSRSISTIYIL